MFYSADSESFFKVKVSEEKKKWELKLQKTSDQQLEEEEDSQQQQQLRQQQRQRRVKYVKYSEDLINGQLINETFKYKTSQGYYLNSGSNLVTVICSE